MVVASGDAARWKRLTSVLLEVEEEKPAVHKVESVRSYKDRLVLKLEGYETAGQAAGLKGGSVHVQADQIPALPVGEYYLEYLIGLAVHEDGETLGIVTDVLESSGTHVLVIHDASGQELMVPLVKEIVKEVDEEGSGIEVVLPDGLKELGAVNEGDRS